MNLLPRWQNSATLYELFDYGRASMNAKTLLAVLFLVSIVVASTTIVRALPREAEPNGDAEATQPAHEILVAARPLAAGTLLRAEDVRWGRATTPGQYVGEIARQPTAKREGKPEIDDEARGEVRGA